MSVNEVLGLMGRELGLENPYVVDAYLMADKGATAEELTAYWQEANEAMAELWEDVWAS